jgi:hypothetical protein
MQSFCWAGDFLKEKQNTFDRHRTSVNHQSIISQSVNQSIEEVTMADLKSPEYIIFHTIENITHKSQFSTDAPQ